MPRVPTYSRPTEIPSGSGVRIPRSASGGFGSALAGLAEIGKKKDESESLSTAQDILNETRLGVESDLDELRRSGMNSGQFQKDSRNVFRKWQDHAQERSKSIKTAEAQGYLAGKLGEFSVTTQIALGDEFDKKFRDEQRAGVLMQVPGIEARAIRATTQTEMDSAIRELKDFLGSHTNYALTQEEATKTYLESVDNVREQRVRDAILADPVGGLNILGSEQSQDLKPAQVDRLARFATAQINAQEAKARRDEAEETRKQTLKKKVSETSFTRDILRGRDVTQKLAGPEGRDLDGPSMRALVDFQKSFRTAGAEGPSDPIELLRWRIAARTGRDPASGQRVKWTDITRADLNSKDKGDLVDKLLDHEEKTADKALTLRDKRRGRGENQIRLLLSGKDGLLASIIGSGGDGISDLNLYEALMEYDAHVDQQQTRDPLDIADQVAKQHARAVVSRFAGDTNRLMDGFGVKSLDELMDKVEAGQIPRAQADKILRLGKFLKFRDEKAVPTGPDVNPTVEESKGYFDAVRRFFSDGLFGPGSQRSKTPSKQ